MPITATSSPTNILYGGGGVFFVEERLVDGSPLGTPDASNLISYIGELKISRKSSIAQIKKVMVKSNAAEEFEAVRAYNPGLATAASAPDITLTFPSIESDINMLGFYEQVRGKYFVIGVPLGKRGATSSVDGFYFVQFEDAGDISFSDSKATEVPITATVVTNFVAVTCAVPSDHTILKATAATIALRAGFKLVTT
jgi:hypothetical protein